MKLTENFHIDEFKCKDGTGVPDEYFETVKTLAEQLQKTSTIPELAELKSRNTC